MATARGRLPSPLLLVASAGGPDLRLHDREVSIGSAAGNTVVLADPQAPACAARIAPRADGWHLIPVGAPVNVNGLVLAEPTRLVRGDRLRIGRYQLAVSAPPQSAAPSPADGWASSTTPSAEARASALDDARARMAWGHPIDQVKATLIAGGFSPGEVDAELRTMMRGERSLTRRRGAWQIAAAVPTILAGIAIVLLFGRLLRAALFGYALIVLGVGGLLHGLNRIVFGAREGHRIG
ncbi:MAG TPA: FHA domain-containing protein [Kofleriaceae bacterium]|nr:FHA domain-containing protein [Kofleriaceae bacterium]